MSALLPARWPIAPYLAVFMLSGAAGLVYESIWSHYLKLFLGHAGYAQTLVLAIFMGGMAVGSWLAARYSRRWRSLLYGYAIAEAVIGVVALGFHHAFVNVTEAAFDHLLPGLDVPAAALAKWALATALILPQSVLLGMTFPLMSGGLIRRHPAAPGATLAALYFANSLGAGIGVLVAGFVLIERYGLPGTMQAAGLLNLVVAAAVALLARGSGSEPAPQPAAAPSRRARRTLAWMLAVAALTGTASFVYEIAWIRMLTLVLGAATHSFELMLSAFILGLACGGLWIRGRIDRVAEPRRLLGVVQIVMGLAALATLPLYGWTFELMRAAMEALARTETGYGLYHAVSHGIALLVMFPAAFCAGMTLPLITCSLLQRGHGEASIGAVYAANTLGAIVGVFLAAHLGLPWLGLKGTLVFGAAIDVGLGLALLWAVLPRRSRALAAAGALVAAAFAATVAGVELDRHRMVSGVFRHGQLFTPQETKLLYYKDGRTASVSLVEFPDGLSLRTNGKSDGGVNLKGPPISDETTMTLTAALPLAIKPEARRVAVIGIGTGITTHTLLGDFELEAVDTIEIESAMAEAARLIRPRNTSAFADPRSRIHIDDAKTYFSTRNQRYDVIISEPSNPWVSGVSSLFTLEFYRLARRHLADDGILVQWFQLYETEIPLLASVVGALGLVFPDYVIYAANDKDLLIVAGESGVLNRPLADVFRMPAVAKELKTVNVHSIGDLDIRRLGGRRALEPFFQSYAAPANSDYYPYLDLNAPRLRFLKREATDILGLNSEHAAFVALFDDAPPQRPSSGLGGPDYAKTDEIRKARYAVEFLLAATPPEPVNIPRGLQKDLELVQVRLLRCQDTARFDSWLHSLYQLGLATTPYLSAAEAGALWKKLGASPCVAALPAEQRRWVLLLKAVAERDAAMMAATGEELLAAPAAGLASTASRRYVVAVTVAGLLAQGKHGAARALWQRYEREVTGSEPLGIGLRFIRAHALRPQ